MPPQEGYSTANYHGAVPANERQANYDSFLKGDAHIMVTTDLAARGLDKVRQAARIAASSASSPPPALPPLSERPSALPPRLLAVLALRGSSMSPRSSSSILPSRPRTTCIAAGAPRAPDERAPSPHS